MKRECVCRDAERARARVICTDLFERKGKQAVQSLLIPLRIEFSGARSLDREKLGSLNAAGIGIRHFGGNTFLVDALPVCLENQEVEEVIQAFLEGQELPKNLSVRIKGASPRLKKGELLSKSYLNATIRRDS